MELSFLASRVGSGGSPPARSLIARIYVDEIIMVVSQGFPKRNSLPSRLDLKHRVKLPRAIEAGF
jgi:hypothetical protein